MTRKNSLSPSQALTKASCMDLHLILTVWRKAKRLFLTFLRGDAMQQLYVFSSKINCSSGNTSSLWNAIYTNWFRRIFRFAMRLLKIIYNSVTERESLWRIITFFKDALVYILLYTSKDVNYWNTQIIWILKYLNIQIVVKRTSWNRLFASFVKPVSSIECFFQRWNERKPVMWQKTMICMLISSHGI